MPADGRWDLTRRLKGKSPLLTDFYSVIQTIDTVHHAATAGRMIKMNDAHRFSFADCSIGKIDEH